jgi:hypothetical protein
MTTRLGLSAMKCHTSYAPLAALGYVLPQSDFFAPWREPVQLGGKTILHEPYQKLVDDVVSVLADCASLKQSNTRLRPETALAPARSCASTCSSSSARCSWHSAAPHPWPAERVVRWRSNRRPSPGRRP